MDSTVDSSAAPRQRPLRPDSLSSSHASGTPPEPIEADAAAYGSLHRALYARRAEYTRPRRARIQIGTWNVAACPGTDQDLAAWFSADVANPAYSDPVDLFVLGLQEIVDLNVASQYMSRVYSDAGLPAAAVAKWTAALEAALPPGCRRVASEQMSGLLLLVYASPAFAPAVSQAHTSAVGTVLLGLFGNKGAVSARLVLGETTRIVFLNCHLASGNDPSNVDRRCWDVAHIESRTEFAPYRLPGLDSAPPPLATDVAVAADAADAPEKLGDEDAAFWFGDLNFRLDDLPGDDIRRLLTLHARGEYDLSQAPDAGSPLAGEDAVVLSSSSSSSSPISSVFEPSAAASPAPPSPPDMSDSIDDSSIGCASADGAASSSPLSALPDPDDFLPDPADDPASLQATLDSLLPHDQLLRVMKQQKAFHDGWSEGHIGFLPSYKYDVGTVGLFDSSEKRRAPSWCDRILYRTRRDRNRYHRRRRDEEAAQKRDAEMKARGLDRAVTDERVLFEYEPDEDDEDEGSARPAIRLYEYDDATAGGAGDSQDDADADADADSDSNGHVHRIQQEIYTSFQRIQSSDHKPVLSVLSIEYDAVVPELKAKVYAEVAKELDRAENEGRPTVTVVVDPAGEGDVVDFGPLDFWRRATASLTIANTGRVNACFSFVEAPLANVSSSPLPPAQWLTTSFVRQDARADGASRGEGEGEGDDGVREDEALTDIGKDITLEPGETISAQLDALIDQLSLARLLNAGDAALEDVLVLRVADGRDHFIPVRGTWSPTCIGRSLDELVRVPDGGIRAFVASLVAGGEGNSRLASRSIPYDSEVRCAAPKELFKLTEALESLTDRAIADEQMLDEYRIPVDLPGWPFELLPGHPEPDPNDVVAVLRALDDDRPLLDAFAPEVPSLRRLEVVAKVLLLFLQGLTDGIVPPALWSLMDEAGLPATAAAATAAYNSSVGSGSSRNGPASSDPQTAILDILSAAPHHNISFVFLTSTLSRIVAELSPLSLADLDALRAIQNSHRRSARSTSGFGAAMGTLGSLGRRSVSARRSTLSSAALGALGRRQARERRVAEIFAGVLCRAPLPAKDKERRQLEDRQRAIIELFVRRSRDELG